MTEQFTRDADIRYAFAPNPEPVEGILYRVHVLFEEPDGRLWSTGTDLTAPNLKTAQGLADRLNAPLGWKMGARMAFAHRFFEWDRARKGSRDADPAVPAD